MTFKETDFPGLIKFLKNFVKEDTNPALVKEVVIQLVKLYEEVPVYPGIVCTCMGGLTKTVDPTTIEIGQKVFFRNQEDYYTGTVAGKDSVGVTLKGVKSLVAEDELELGFKEMGKVTVVNEKVLEEMWPSFVFPKGAR